MSHFPQTNAPWTHPADPNTVGGDYPFTSTSRPSDRNVELLHRRRQCNTDLQVSPHPLAAEIQENGAAAPQPVMPPFYQAQYSTMKDLTTNNGQHHEVVPAKSLTLINLELQPPPMNDSALNNVERRPVTPADTAIPPEHGSRHSASGDLEMDGVEHHVASRVQMPLAGEDPAVHTDQEYSAAAAAQVPTQVQARTNCDQCLGNGRSCNGGQLNSKMCIACKTSKRSCSFIPRKYACQHCEKDFMRAADLKRHNTNNHKLLVQEAYKTSSPTNNSSTPVAQLQNEVQQVIVDSDTSRPSKRLRKDSKKTSPKHTDTSAPQIRSTQQPSSQQDHVTPYAQTDLTGELSSPIQQEMLHLKELYQPDSPAYKPAHEPLDEIPDTPALSHQHQSSRVEHVVAQNQPLDSDLQLAQPEQASLRSGGAQLPSTSRTSTVVLQQLSSSQLEQISPLEKVTSYQNTNADVYLQFPNRVMDDNYVERSLRVIRKEVKGYEEFIRCTDPQYSTSEVEDQFNFLKEVQPFVYMNEVQEEANEFFAVQPSRLIVLWRLLLGVHPTASLRDKLIRFELEGLKLPVVICGTLAYVLLRTIFDEPDWLRAAERAARFESVRQLHGVKFAAESIKHDQLFIHKDRSVDRELRKSARDLSERQFYDLLYPLTHWDLANPTTQRKDVHIQKLSDIALKSLRLSRELQARTTESYSYFWPHPGELFNQNDHIETEDGQAGSQIGRIIKWTLMFGVKVSREGHELVYAKAVVITMEA